MLEYLGYLASIIVLISLLMSSIKKLRWINLIGSITFATYGFLIGSIPVGLLNIGTVCINVYYLTKMYTSKDYFKILPLDQHTNYLKYFMNFYQKDMVDFGANFDVSIEKSEVSFYILRNVIPAGLFVSSKVDDTTLRVDIDYVVPQYRDFKMGDYIFRSKKNIFTDRGFTTLVTYTNNKKHETYLKKMGFQKQASTDESTVCYKLHL